MEILLWLIDTFASILFAYEGGQLVDSPYLRVFIGLLECCGGGAILRDWLLLHRIPVILSDPVMLFICAKAALIDLSYCPVLLPLADVYGIGIFIIGGSGHGHSFCEKTLCGFFSGTGGGFLSAVVRGKIRRIKDLATLNRILSIVFSFLHNLPMDDSNNIYNFQLWKLLLPFFFVLLDSRFRIHMQNIFWKIIKQEMLPQPRLHLVVLVMIDVSTWKPHRKPRCVL